MTSIIPEEDQGYFINNCKAGILNSEIQYCLTWIKQLQHWKLWQKKSMRKKPEKQN